MAIVTLNSVQEATGLTFTGADATSVTTLAAAVDAALKRYLRPFQPEPLPLTNIVLDAPLSRDLYLPVVPARSVTSIYYRSDANGLVSNFTADDLLDNSAGDQYQLVIDDNVSGWARAGLLRRVGQEWGASTYRPAGRLGYREEGERGALLVNYLAGPTSVPADIEQAGVMAVLQLFDRRKRGSPLTSESWNGYSGSLASQFTADAAIRSPEVVALLAPYLAVAVA